ncbi:diaminopimelate epimerase [Mumia flava]|uniref:Diaminopimelate epimerase n=1 Tax=Mumia flava TaxID=1348852 RepID=A0A0B2BAN8_9ACTN|nr:diaminopimelate epimerase [Mumia flava]PJJ53810.1 diaminopimelate epimerase [Mumia flava]
MTSFAWLKGHGTENDFVLLPDPEGDVHGTLDAAFVAGLCHRRRGLGADGVMRVIRTAALAAKSGDPAIAGQAAEWFMDYRNADGSVSEMCGNGIRVFARYLAEADLVDPTGPVPIGTRDGVKVVTYDGDRIAVDMGAPTLLPETKVSVGDRTWPARHVDVGNPHAVAFVDDLADAGTLLDEPGFDASVYPEGVNVEFVVRRGPLHVGMRVHERGSGETRSCGTGAVAVAVATAALDDVRPAEAANRCAGGTYRVDVPGGTLHITIRPDGHAVLAGPAEITARGEMTWLG